MDISKIWPGWTITERLGHGGFGHVYKATCAETDAVAAVKVITIPDNPDIIEDLRYSGRSDDEILAMCHEEAEHMMEEIKVMQKLKGSANIVSIEDSALRKKEDSIGYDIYIRMEYLIPLKNRIAELSPLTDEAVVKIGCDICSALEICHKKTASKRQIIHRDIKPDNILYHELSDAYKLGDFGIARERFDTTNTLTRGIGTARFIAPEVEAGSVYDHRADLYSLGLLLYFLRNRERLPFEYLGHVVDDTSVSRAKWKRVHGNEPIPPPIDASPALTEVILKACAYEPKDRYASAADMKEALLKALKQPYKTTSQTQTTYDKTVPSSSGAAFQTTVNGKPKTKKAVRWILGLVVAGVLIYYGLPWLFWDEVMGDSTITYEDTSGTDPETVVDPAEVLMIENTTDTEEPAIETINTALVLPTEEETQETDAETELPVDITVETEPETVSISDNTVETAPETVQPADPAPVEEGQNIPAVVTAPAITCGGISKDTAVSINLEETYTISETNSSQEEWYKFKTSSNASIYYFTASNYNFRGYTYYIIYNRDHTEIMHDSIFNSENRHSIILSPETEYWIQVKNNPSCTYIFSITEQPVDGGMTRAEAHPITLNTSYDKKLEIAELPDWYSFTTTENQAVYRFYLNTEISESPIRGFTDLTLYDVDGIKIKECSVSSNAEFFDILLQPKTKYYIRIGGNHNVGTGDYRFYVSELICDAGTSRNSALALKYGERHTGQINSTLSDWYQIEIPDTGDHVFKLHNIDTGADVKCQIYLNSSNSYMFSSNASNEDSSSRSFSLKQGDILYLKIFSESFAANGTYIFEILPEE